MTFILKILGLFVVIFFGADIFGMQNFSEISPDQQLLICNFVMVSHSRHNGKSDIICKSCNNPLCKCYQCGKTITSYRGTTEYFKCLCDLKNRPVGFNLRAQFHAMLTYRLVSKEWQKNVDIVLAQQPNMSILWDDLDLGLYYQHGPPSEHVWVRPRPYLSLILDYYSISKPVSECIEHAKVVVFGGGGIFPRVVIDERTQEPLGLIAYRELEKMQEGNSFFYLQKKDVRLLCCVREFYKNSVCKTVFDNRVVDRPYAYCNLLVVKQNSIRSKLNPYHHRTKRCDALAIVVSPRPYERTGEQYAGSPRITYYDKGLVVSGDKSSASYLNREESNKKLILLQTFDLSSANGFDKDTDRFCSKGKQELKSEISDEDELSDSAEEQLTESTRKPNLSKEENSDEDGSNGSTSGKTDESDAKIVKKETYGVISLLKKNILKLFLILRIMFLLRCQF